MTSTMVPTLGCALLLAGCASSSFIDAGCDGALFGQPSANTGLDGAHCRGTCSCSGITSRDFTKAELDALTRWTNSTPFDALPTDPYEASVPEPTPGVCAVVVEAVPERRYHLQTFSDVATAEAAGALLTHHDACGRCSPLADLAVYARERDVGAAVKQCGLDHFDGPVTDVAACIEALGFTHPCAQTWAFNLRHTQAKCLSACLAAGPYHHADGTLSECLACDERESGPTFKAIAGRTRRNTGLATAICRPCSEARPVAHAYP